MLQDEENSDPFSAGRNKSFAIKFQFCRKRKEMFFPLKLCCWSATKKIYQIFFLFVFVFVFCLPAFCFIYPHIFLHDEIFNNVENSFKVGLTFGKQQNKSISVTHCSNCSVETDKYISDILSLNYHNSERIHVSFNYYVL